VRPKAASRLGISSVRSSRRALAAHGAIAAVMPTPHGRRHRRSLGIAERADRGERFGIVLAAGEDKIAACGECRCFLEQARVVAFDVVR